MAKLQGGSLYGNTWLIECLLTIEDIKFWNPVIRNNQLVAFSTHTLPYSGLGSGIKRAIEKEPQLELVNDIEGEQFKVIIPRPERK